MSIVTRLHRVRQPPGPLKTSTLQGFGVGLELAAQGGACAPPTGLASACRPLPPRHRASAPPCPALPRPAEHGCVLAHLVVV